MLQAGAIVRYWPVSDGLISTVATQDQTSVCFAISRASSTSVPRYRTVLSSFVCAHLLLAYVSQTHDL